MLLSSALCMALLVPAAEDKKDVKPADLIVGKWASKASATATGALVEMTMEFDKDGTFTRTAGKTTAKGKYKIVDDTLEMETTTSAGKTVTNKAKFTVTKDKLTLEIERGTTKAKTEYKRVTK